MDASLEREIKKAVEEKRAIIGTNRTIDAMAKKQVISVVIAENCPEKITSRIDKTPKPKDMSIKQAQANAKDIGTLCRKPFPVSVLGIKK